MSLIHHRGAPLAQLARALGWQGWVAGWMPLCGVRGRVLMVFLCEGGL